jgi:hypothetical protein
MLLTKGAEKNMLVANPCHKHVHHPTDRSFRRLFDESHLFGVDTRTHFDSAEVDSALERAAVEVRGVRALSLDLVDQNRDLSALQVEDLGLTLPFTGTVIDAVAGLKVRII